MQLSICDVRYLSLAVLALENRRSPIPSHGSYVLGQCFAGTLQVALPYQDGLYSYDAIGRLQDSALLNQNRDPNTPSTTPPIGQYIRLGPLGTALLPSKIPRVVLIDEIDKSDIDLPNDLLNVIEEGEFSIPELFRLRHEYREEAVLPADGDKPVKIIEGQVRCREFPLIVLTSNGERELSPAFLRRCLRLHLSPPRPPKLALILEEHLTAFHDQTLSEAEHKRLISERDRLIQSFLSRATEGEMATDQLMSAMFMMVGRKDSEPGATQHADMTKRLLWPLNKTIMDAQ